MSEVKAREDMILPTTEEIEAELKRLRRARFSNRKRRVVFAVLAVLIALAVLVVVFVMPMIVIYGDSMTPTLHENNVVLALKDSEHDRGDIIAFNQGDNVLVKRVIAFSGEWVDFDSEGHVYINGNQLSESYIHSFDAGKCDFDLPYQVPEGCVYVLNDNRSMSKDSRNDKIGAVAEENIIGRVVFRIWPLNKAGGMN